MGTHLSNKHSQKNLDSVKKSPTDAIKNASKIAIQNTAGANGDLTGSKTVDKITNISKKYVREPQISEANDEIEILKERYIFPERRLQDIDELRLI